jgi:hypothetical protein
MARRKGTPPAPLTAEQVKAQIDLLDRMGQFNLFTLILSDPGCHLGELIRAVAEHHLRLRTLTERHFGVDPQPLPPAKRSGKVLTNPERQAKHKAKKRRATFLKHLGGDSLRARPVRP